MMLQEIKALAKNNEFYWTMLFQGTTLVGGILLIKLLAVSLSKSDYGFYALITSLVSLILMMPFTAMTHGMGRYISIYRRKRLYEEFMSSVFFIIAIFLIIDIFLLYIITLFFTAGAEWGDVLIIIAIFVVSEILKIFFRTIDNINRERRNIAIAVFLEFFIKVGIIYCFYVLSAVDIETVISTLVLGNIACIVVLLLNNMKELSVFKISKEKFTIHFLRIWIFAYPLIICSIFVWMRDMSNRWYLNHFLEKEHVALFSMIGSLALVAPVALQGLLGSYLIPIIYQEENIQKGYSRRLLSTLLPFLCGIFMIVFVFVYIFKDFIVLFLTDEKYLSISWMLPWMFLTYSFYVIAMVSSLGLYAQNQTKRMILPTILPGIISVVGGYIFIGEYGINGAFYNYILIYTISAALVLYVVYKYNKELLHNCVLELRV